MSKIAVCFCMLCLNQSGIQNQCRFPGPLACHGLQDHPGPAIKVSTKCFCPERQNSKEFQLSSK